MTQAFIADELRSRLLEHAPEVALSSKKLELSSASLLKEYQDAEFDCVIASLILISEEDRLAFFKEVHRILLPRGIFLFSTLGENNYHKLERLGDDFLKEGFKLPVVDREVLQLQYDNEAIFLQELALSNITKNFVQIERKSSEDIIATFDVFYGYALRGDIQTKASGNIEIPLDQIKIRRT